MFIGQGFYYFVFGKEFYEYYLVFCQNIDEFDCIVQIYGFLLFLFLIDGSEFDVFKLFLVVVQFGLVCFEMVFVCLWIFWGICFVVVFGYSLGEYVVFEVVGVFFVSDVIYFVGVCVQFFVEKCIVGIYVMFVIMGFVEIIMDVFGVKVIGVNVVCINGFCEIVFSGEFSEMVEIV